MIIAVSEYTPSSGLRSIEFCKNDGEEMYTILKKNGYDIPDDRKLIGFVDSQKIRSSVYNFFADENNKPDDTILFYYSGHGVPHNNGKAFSIPSDINSLHPLLITST